jgi:hypothetical protein
MSDGSSEDRPVVTCDPSMSFGDPILVYGLNRQPGKEYRLFLSPDELTAYVAVGSGELGAHLYASKRANRTEPFGNLSPFTALNTHPFELKASVTGDGLTIFFDIRPETTTRIYAAKRTRLDEQFVGPEEVLLNRSSPDEFDPYVLPDGSALYFATVINNQGLVFRAELHGTRAEPPVLVPVAGQRTPVVSQDELTIYFGSGATNVGGDMAMATRTSRELAFGPPTLLTELNAPESEAGQLPQWISPDGCRLYFSRAYVDGGTYSMVAERKHD